MTITPPPIEWHLQVANGAAMNASVARAMLLGMHVVIERFRWRDPADPIPAPGADELADGVVVHTLQALHAAASCEILADEIRTAARPDARELEDALFDASERARQGTLGAQRSVRNMAQVAFGVAQHALPDDDAEMLERTALGVLMHESTGTNAVRDRFPVVGRTAAEVSVELAGLLARMLCDLSSGNDPAPWFAICADGMEDVEVEIGSDGEVTVHGVGVFAAPVTITEVTTRTLAAISRVDETLVERLELRWRDEKDD